MASPNRSTTMGLMSHRRAHGRARPLQGGAGTVAVGPEGDDAALQQVVGVGRPLLDQLVEPAQALVGLEGLLLQQLQALVDGGGLLRAAAGERGEQRLEPLGLQQPVGEWVVTRLSSLSMRIERPLHAVRPWRAQLEHV